MKIKSADFPVKLSVFMLCVTAYFYAILGNGYVMLAISLSPMIFLFFSYINKIESNMLPWIIFAILAIVSSLFTTQLKESTKFVLVLWSLFIAKLVLQREFSWWGFFLKIVYAFSAFNVIGVLLSLFAPDFMIEFAFSVYGGENLEMYVELFRNDSFPGWNAQTAITAFFISVFIAFIVSDMLRNPKKVINYFFLTVSLLALLLTKKRSFIISNLVALLFLLWNTGRNKKGGNRVFVFFVIAAIVFGVVYYSVAWKEMLDKWEIMGASGDVSNGRFALWEDTYNVWKKAPFFGVGTNVLVKEYRLSSHNAFLQLLAEMGIFGAVTYVYLLLSSLKQGVSALRNMEISSESDPQATYMLSTSFYVQILFIVYSFFGNPVYGIHIMLLFTVFTALPGSYNNYLRMKNNESRNFDIS